MARAPPARRVKGVNLIGIVKLLKGLRKKRPILGLSQAAEAMLAEHVLISDWYPFEPFIELIGVVFREILKKDEQSALQMGIAGGRAALSGFHKQFIRVGDPVASLFAMRLAWRTYFDFGELTTEQDGPRAVRFVLEGYPDLTACHGLLIVGWHVATALEAGAPEASGEVLESPWRGDRRLVHRVAYTGTPARRE